ncbi:phenylacetate-CoA oxygenase subunit PaaC [Pelomonas sp. CA6]|uniref:1,2-phenylacetyl-CoA epoxidase subunit PaaC n=1 Tax=Pelomonas sp. CA6 TaxID=2907999 RepID=UPI001F4A789D|nr:1,2-phenylacetyl-CoA epoxidase subunit PaaC [Pelomonas sp. CA6]MCH7342440.1 phenylacetate-CoA oxygenase subunit PaaC [Pelomonas sp. CA6]
MTQASITVVERADIRYLLRLADSCLVLSQRLGEWCGHAPILEEDLALTNMALDLLGQARGVLTRVGQLNGAAGGSVYDEDQLAFLRDERQYLNPVLMELPRGDFAFTQLRNLMVSSWLLLLWQRLQASSDAEIAAIAEKALKEARYHQQHAADWVLRLGDGTEESARRCREALDQLWPYVGELFSDDDADAAAQASGLGPAWSTLKGDWLAQLDEVLAAAKLARPKDSAHVFSGRRGVHSEHMGHMLATLQYLQRAYPGGRW